MNVYCRIRTLVKSVFAAFVVGAVAGFLAATGDVAGPVAPASHDSTLIFASAQVQR